MGISNKIFEVFQRAQGGHQDSLSTSLPYYYLTGRKNIKVRTEGDASVTMTDHPHDENTLFVFPEINGNGDLTVDILNQLSHQKKKVELARYTDEDLTKLQAAIKRARISQIKSITIKAETIMDWRYPVRLIDTIKVANLETTGLEKDDKQAIRGLRTKYNKANRHVVRQIPLTDPDAMKIMRASILIWNGQMIMASRDTPEDMTTYYNILIQAIDHLPNLNGFALELDNGPGGFTIWEEQDGVANGLATLGGRFAPGLSEFHQIAACKVLAEKGIARYNMGGSEEKSLDDFKLKFLPCESIDINTFEVNYHPPETAPAAWHYTS